MVMLSIHSGAEPVQAPGKFRLCPQVSESSFVRVSQSFALVWRAASDLGTKQGVKLVIFEGLSDLRFEAF